MLLLESLGYRPYFTGQCVTVINQSSFVFFFGIDRMYEHF